MLDLEKEHDDDAPFTFESVDQEVELASAWKRIVAVLINVLIFFVSVHILWQFMYKNFSFKYFNDMTTLIYLLIQAIMLSISGQSIGKKIMGLRVVRSNGEIAGFLHAMFLRELIPLLVMDVIIHVTHMILFVVFVLSCLVMLFVHRERRTLQDLLADTVVIELPKPKHRIRYHR